ncbi:hypothetical protein [Aquamicrobium zhengzhouense]|uniref:Uncharacterized protein n=1 Tax=Aquamicrobium zhengzhouense TaxID=2781738 RepID=A0ABS0SBJ8_9HYPH|nr:hypothetical protein [Aquamicrobium zhengzhouense]MBI1620668.1 hypothetical protein [Aquamicrobium zhengzhouense]
MSPNSPRDGQPGTTDQSPRWEGPEETRPAGYLPAIDAPETQPDAAGETLSSAEADNAADALAARNRAQAEKAPKDTQYAGHEEFSQDAAGNKPPEGIGNSETPEEVESKTRQSEGVNPPASQQPPGGGGRETGRHDHDA